MQPPESLIPGTKHTYEQLGQCFAIDPGVARRLIHNGTKAFINVPLGLQIMAQAVSHRMDWSRVTRTPTEQDLDELRRDMTRSLLGWLSRSDYNPFRDARIRTLSVNTIVTKLVTPMNMRSMVDIGTANDSHFRLLKLALAFVECQSTAFQTEWATAWIENSLLAYGGTLDDVSSQTIASAKGITERLFYTISSILPVSYQVSKDVSRLHKLNDWLRVCYQADPENYTTDILRRYIHDQIIREVDDNDPNDWVDIINTFVNREGASLAGGSCGRVPAPRSPRKRRIR